jgi:hypothetical protein
MKIPTPRSLLRAPSPAMVVAIVALIMAMSGTAVATVAVARFAQNAGKVDGKDAVLAGTSPATAAGKLVTLNRSGISRGHFSSAYLPPFVAGKGQVTSFGRGIDVPDNASGAAQTIVSLPGLGAITATCSDQNNGANIEDPQTIIAFVNGSGANVNYARSTGNGAVQVGAPANGTATNTQINGSNTFEIVIHGAGRSATIHGAVREDARGSNAAFCTVFGNALQIG